MADADDDSGTEKAASPRGALLIIVTLLLLAPTLKLFVTNQLGAVQTAERAAVAIAIAWAAVGGVGSLVDSYRHRNARSYQRRRG